MRRYFLNDEKINIRITEWGATNARVIFCLHGLGSTSLSFIEIAEQLKDEFRIISIDAPGHGKTDPFPTAEDYELPSLAKWLDRVIEMLQIEKFFFLSHSWGSFVSLFYLADFPEKVVGTILIDGGYQSKRIKGQSMEEEAAYYEEDFEGYVETWESFLKDAVYGEVSRKSSLLELAARDLVLERNNKFYWHARGITGSHIIKGMHKHEITDIFDELPADILLLRAALPAEQEDYRAKTSQLFEQKARGNVKVIPHTTHMLHWDRPEVVVSVIRKNWSIL